MNIKVSLIAQLFLTVFLHITAAETFLLNTASDPDFPLEPLKQQILEELDLKSMEVEKLPLDDYLFLKDKDKFSSIRAGLRAVSFHGDLVRQRNLWILVITRRSENGAVETILPLILNGQGLITADDLKPLTDSKSFRKKSNPVICIDPGHGGRDPGASDVNREWPEKRYNNLLSRQLADELKARGYFVYFTRRPEDDIWVDLPDRTGEALRIEPDLFISIHHNSGEEGQGICLFYSSHNQRLDKKDSFFNYNGSEYQLLEQKRKIRTMILYYMDSRGRKGVLELPKRQSPFVYDLTPSRESRQSLKALILFLSEMSRNPEFSLYRYSNEFLDDRDYFVLRDAPCPSILIEAGFLNNPEEVRRLRDPAYRDRNALHMADAIDRYFQITAFSP